MKMKDGSTHLSYKAEQAVDLDTGAIVAITTHGGATGDTTSLEKTLPEAGMAIAQQIATQTAQGQYKVDERGLQEVVTDKGYHSIAGLVKLAEAGVRSYIPEKKQQRNWAGKDLSGESTAGDGGAGQAIVTAARRAPGTAVRASIRDGWDAAVACARH